MFNIIVHYTNELALRTLWFLVCYLHEPCILPTLRAEINFYKVVYLVMIMSVYPSGFIFLIFSSADVNECTTNRPQDQHNCHQNASCTNTHGSFLCRCIDVYTGDGVSCVGKYFMTHNGIFFLHPSLMSSNL